MSGDRKGMDPEALTTALFKHRPRLVYAAPACTDPEGACWSPERRTAAQHRCREAGVTFVADDRQELLLFDAEERRPLRRTEPGTLSLGQLPPGLIAGLKIGWIAGAPDLIDARSGAPSSPTGSGAGCGPNELATEALAGYIAEQPLEPMLAMLRVQCRERMRKMTEQLAAKRVPDLTWSKPEGGLHLWITLPEGLEGEALLRGAWLKGLIFQPGAPYYAANPRSNTARLTYAFADEKELKLGVARLAESIEEFTGRWSRS